MRSCEYLVTVNYTRYRFIFCWQIRATIPWVLPPKHPFARHPPPPILFFFSFSSLLVDRRRSGGHVSSVKRSSAPLPLPVLCVSHYRYFSQRLSYSCVYACVRVFRVSYRPRVFVNGLTINFRHIISSLPVGDTCFRQFLFFISASSRSWRFCSFQFRVNPVSISIFNV